MSTDTDLLLAYQALVLTGNRSYGQLVTSLGDINADGTPDLGIMEPDMVLMIW